MCVMLLDRLTSILLVTPAEIRTGIHYLRSSRQLSKSESSSAKRNRCLIRHQIALTVSDQPIEIAGHNPFDFLRRHALQLRDIAVSGTATAGG